MPKPTTWYRSRGVACVEAALLLPVAVLFVFGFVEYGYYMNCHHVVHDAARQGARAAARTENSNAEVKAAVVASLNHSYSVDASAVTVRISKLNSGGAEEYQVMNLSANEQGHAIRVTVTVDYAQFHPPCDFFGFASQQLAGSVAMPRQN